MAANGGRAAGTAADGQKVMRAFEHVIPADSPHLERSLARSCWVSGVRYWPRLSNYTFWPSKIDNEVDNRLRSGPTGNESAWYAEAVWTVVAKLARY